MPAIKLTTFAGELPRADARLLPANGAQVAVNSMLDDGTLTPVHEPAFVVASPIAAPKTLYRHLNQWLAWSTKVHAVPGPVDDTRLYLTGDGAPKMIAGGATWPLAMPRPSGALAATLAGSGSGDVVSRIYVYTWVSAFGEESEPSPASTIIDWKPGNTVNLTGFAATPAGRNITKQRIYRTQTGSLGTFLYFIAERDATNAAFSDTIPVAGFSEPLPSTDWNAPPANLSGLVSLPNGMMAAFAGRQVYFCEPFRPHAWPEKYTMTVDADIVGLIALGGSLIVLTKTHPHIGVGSTPSSFQFEKIENNWPCINAGAIVDLGFAACYPTHEGLVAIDAGGASRLITEQLFSRRQWEQLAPGTMVAGQLAGRYLAFYAGGGPSGFEAGSVSISLGANPFLSRSQVRARATYFDVEEAALYYVPHNRNEIWRYDAPNSPLETQYWRSKQFVLNAPHNFGAMLVDAKASISAEDLVAAEARRQAIIDSNNALMADTLGGELGGMPINQLGLNGDLLQPLPRLPNEMVVGVLADGVRVADVRATNRPVRLPAGFTARLWEIDITGDVSVNSVVMGTTMADIEAVG